MVCSFATKRRLLLLSSMLQVSRLSICLNPWVTCLRTWCSVMDRVNWRVLILLPLFSFALALPLGRLGVKCCNITTCTFVGLPCEFAAFFFFCEEIATQSLVGSNWEVCFFPTGVEEGNNFLKALASSSLGLLSCFATLKALVAMEVDGGWKKTSHQMQGHNRPCNIHKHYVRIKAFLWCSFLLRPNGYIIQF